jgi:hypothetical protein
MQNLRKSDAANAKPYYDSRRPAAFVARVYKAQRF